MEDAGLADAASAAQQLLDLHRVLAWREQDKADRCDTEETQNPKAGDLRDSGSGTSMGSDRTVTSGADGGDGGPAGRTLTRRDSNNAPSVEDGGRSVGRAAIITSNCAPGSRLTLEAQGASLPQGAVRTYAWPADRETLRPMRSAESGSSAEAPTERAGGAGGSPPTRSASPPAAIDANRPLKKRRVAGEARSPTPLAGGYDTGAQGMVPHIVLSGALQLPSSRAQLSITPPPLAASAAAPAAGQNHPDLLLSALAASLSGIGSSGISAGGASNSLLQKAAAIYTSMGATGSAAPLLQQAPEADVARSTPKPELIASTSSAALQLPLTSLAVPASSQLSQMQGLQLSMLLASNPAFASALGVPPSTVAPTPTALSFKAEAPFKTEVASAPERIGAAGTAARCGSGGAKGGGAPAAALASLPSFTSRDPIEEYPPGIERGTVVSEDYRTHMWSGKVKHRHGESTVELFCLTALLPEAFAEQLPPTLFVSDLVTRSSVKLGSHYVVKCRLDFLSEKQRNKLRMLEQLKLVADCRLQHCRLVLVPTGDGGDALTVRGYLME